MRVGVYYFDGDTARLVREAEVDAADPVWPDGWPALVLGQYLFCVADDGKIVPAPETWRPDWVADWRP